MRLTIEYISNKFSEAGYKLLETNYIGAKILMSYKCDKGHIHKIKWNNFQSGQRCYTCYILSQRYSIDDINKFLKEIGYQLLSTEYKDNHQKLDIICDKGHQIKMDFNKLKLGTRCKLCFHDNLRLDINDVKKLFEDNGCELLSETYINYGQKLKFKCACGNISYIRYDSFKLGFLCGCQNSVGERKTKKYLTDNDIDYITQKTFSGCFDKQNLRFDFYVDDKFLIEFDGKQHFVQCDAFGKDSLEINKSHDKIKNEYCILYNIKLLRISYKEKNKLDSIINEYIKNIDKKEVITYSNQQIYKTMQDNIDI